MSKQGRMPVGEWIEVRFVKAGENPEWVKIKPLFIGNYYSIVTDNSGLEKLMIDSCKLDWRYPINHEQQKRDEIMEAWRGRSLDFAYDNEKSMVHAGTFIDMLFNKGFVEVEK